MLKRLIIVIIFSINIFVMSPIYGKYLVSHSNIFHKPDIPLEWAMGILVTPSLCLLYLILMMLRGYIIHNDVNK